MKKSWIVGLGVVAVIGSALWMSIPNATNTKEEINTKEKIYAEVFNIIPTGEDVQDNQEIVITFDKEVVPLGSMQRDFIDIDISPKIDCKWRWLNRSSLACTLNRDDKLKLATTYDITIAKNFSKEDNIELDAPYHATFSTVRPRVNGSYIVLWKSPIKPYIKISFSMPVTKKSVQEAFKIINQDNDETHDIELIEQIITEDKTTTKTEYKNDTSDAKTAKDVWIVTPKDDLINDTTYDLTLVHPLLSNEGELRSVKKYKNKFHTFREFAFLGVRCDVNDKNKLLSVDNINLLNNNNKCNPMSSIFLAFSSPVSQKSVAEFVDFNPKLNYLSQSYNPWEGLLDDEYMNTYNYKNAIFYVRIPTFIKANSKHTFTLDKNNIKDAFDRELNGKNEITFLTDNRKPNLTLGYSNIVLEKDVDSDGALYATNLKNIKIDFIRFNPNDINNKTKQYSHAIETMDIKNVAYKTKMGIREALDNKSGILYGEIKSDSLKYNYANVLAQVTPFQVHAKFGHFNTLVWVSKFNDAKPLKDANVTLYYGNKKNLNNLTKISEAKQTNKDGSVMLDGRATLDSKIKKDYQKSFFVHISKDEDEALLPLDYDYRIYSSDFYSYPRALGGHAKFWGTTPQGIYKLGDSVSYKIYYRDQNNTHLIQDIEKELFDLKVYDPLNRVVHQTFNNSLNEFGTMQGELEIDKKAVSGNYRFEIKSKKTNRSWYPLEVQVSDFTPAPFKVTTQLNKNIYMPNDEIKISTHATMFAGGGYANASIRLNAYMQEEGFFSNDSQYKDFYFLNPSYNEKTLLDVRESLDIKGEHEYILKLDDVDIDYGSIIVEASVEDDRGKFVAAYTKANYAQKDKFVGLRNTKWVYEKNKQSAIEVVVLNKDKKPLKGINVDIDVEYKEYRSARVKGAGNAFVVVNSSEWIKDTKCSIKSDKEIKECLFTPTNTGSYRFTATIKDNNNKTSKTQIYGWVVGDGGSVWSQSNDASLDIVPQSDSYKIGERAKYLVKNPFETTQALITIERYGVIDSWIESFDSATPIVEFEVKEEYLPGYYLSVVALSPRVAKPIDGVVDLGKPSYKMGYVQTEVKDSKKELKVSVKSNKEIYKPQEKVSLNIDVKNILNAKEKDYELAVAVVDASVLALNKRGDRYYDLYKGLNKLESLDVENYSLISRLIGRQNFEKKGANQGGDGGDEGLGIKNFRDDFKYIAYWNPSLKLNNDNNAKIEFTLPDNLTEYKVIVLAISKGDSMGHGITTFKVNKEIQVYPIMPNQIIAGDSFDAGFSILNSSNIKRKLKVSLEANGVATAKKDIEIEIKPFTREKVYLPIQTIKDGNITIRAYARDKDDSDALEHVIEVNKKSSLFVMANFGSMIDDEVNEDIKIPKDIEPNVGAITAILSSSVLGNIDGAFTYLKDYPYWCWEQRLSVGIGASNYLSLKEYLDDSLTWDSAEQNIKNMLKDASNYQAPNGGMAFWVGANEYVNPYITAYTALGFSWLKESGYEIDFKVKKKLDNYLETYLAKTKSTNDYSASMNATIRAVALHALARENKLKAYDLTRYIQSYKLMSLFGRAHLFEAMLYTKDLNQEFKDTLLDSILANATQSAGRFDFTEKVEDGYVYLLQSPMRTNCVVLSALIHAKKVGGYEKKIGDIAPKLMRTITQHRGGKNHWENTQENLFCLQAIKDYTEVYESEDISMNVDVLLDDENLGNVEFKSKKDEQKTISKTITQKDIATNKTLTIKKEGEGRLYYTSRISYSPKLSHAKEINAGFEIYREYSIKNKDGYTLLTPPFEIKTGDLLRVDLYIHNSSTKHFVVLNDPIAGGFEPINSTLATASVSDADTSTSNMPKNSKWHKLTNWKEYGWYASGFYHKELKHDGAQFYADYLREGDYHLSYTIQAIASGEFYTQPTHIEQMYDPDVFGKTIPAIFTIK